MKNTVISGSKAIIQCLIEEKVDTIFGYPGGTIMPVYDALYDYRDKINHILTRHEQGLVHAAQGYARASGKVGVCLATSGPGATNLITGIADAMMDSTPLVCIIGQVPSGLLGTDAFQEADIIGMTVPCTKWNYQITDAEEIPEILSKAFFIANSGRPGPVVLMVTKDAQFSNFNFHYEKTTYISSYRPENYMDYNKIKEAANLINAAKKPYVLFGQGVILSGADKQLAKFLEKTGIPAAGTLLGLSALPTDHPNFVGMLGMHGNYGPNLKTNECDVLIGIGLRFDDRVTGDASRYAKQAKVIHIEMDDSEINKIVKADVPIIADAKEALEALFPLVNPGKHQDWHNEFKSCDDQEYDVVVKNDLDADKETLGMALVSRLLSEMTNHEAILVTDVGQHQMIANRYFKFKNNRSVITSGGLGTMGFGLPAAMGAKLAKPERTVISISGDGGFQMTLQELGTIAKYKIPVKMVILNNHFLGMVRQWQEMFFEKRYSFTEMDSPDFVQLAAAYQIPAWRVEKPEDLKSKIKNMLNEEGPALLEILVEKEGNVFPMVPSGAAVDEIILKA